jgi:hypothetical protein
MEAADPSETLVPICQTTKRYITEDWSIYNAIVKKNEIRIFYVYGVKI